MDPVFETLTQYGGFAVLAACALWALWKSHEISMAHLDSSHARETEALKLALTHVAASQGQFANLSQDTVRELVKLSDEVGGLRDVLERKGIVNER